MDMMEVRRRVMMSMASGKLPEGVSVVEFDVTELSMYHTIPHMLNDIPKTIFIVPVNDNYGFSGMQKFNGLYGGAVGTTSSADYPYKLINNYKATNGNWDYTANSLGWNADQNNVYIKMNNSNIMAIGKYILFAKAYPST